MSWCVNQSEARFREHNNFVVSQVQLFAQLRNGFGSEFTKWYVVERPLKKRVLEFSFLHGELVVSCGHEIRDLFHDVTPLVLRFELPNQHADRGS